MILVDNALQAREEEGRPIRVGLIGAGFMGQGLTNQIVNSVPGMQMSAVYEDILRRNARNLTQSKSFDTFFSFEIAFWCC